MNAPSAPLASGSSSSSSSLSSAAAPHEPFSQQQQQQQQQRRHPKQEQSEECDMEVQDCQNVAIHHNKKEEGQDEQQQQQLQDEETPPPPPPPPPLPSETKHSCVVRRNENNDNERAQTTTKPFSNGKEEPDEDDARRRRRTTAAAAAAGPPPCYTTQRTIKKMEPKPQSAPAAVAQDKDEEEDDDLVLLHDLLVVPRAPLLDRLMHWMQARDLFYRIRWAFQFALAALIGAVLLHVPTLSTAFTPPYMVLTFIVVTTAGSCGQGVANFLTGIKIVVISYIAMTIAIAADFSNVHWVLWGVMYWLGTFLIALTTEYVTTFNSELLFVVAMLMSYTKFFGGREESMASSFLIRDVCVGIGLGLLSSTFPFRVYEYETAAEAKKELCQEVALWLDDAIYFMTHQGESDDDDDDEEQEDEENEEERDPTQEGEEGIIHWHPAEMPTSNSRSRHDPRHQEGIRPHPHHHHRRPQQHNCDPQHHHHIIHSSSGGSSSSSSTIGTVMSMRRRRAKVILALQQMRQSASYAWYEPINGLEVAYLDVRCDFLANLVSVLEVVTDLCDDARSSSTAAAAAAVGTPSSSSSPSDVWNRDSAHPHYTKPSLGQELEHFGDVMREFLHTLALRRIEPRDVSRVVLARSRLLERYNHHHHHHSTVVAERNNTDSPKKAAAGASPVSSLSASPRHSKRLRMVSPSFRYYASGGGGRGLGGAGGTPLRSHADATYRTRVPPTDVTRREPVRDPQPNEKEQEERTPRSAEAVGRRGLVDNAVAVPLVVSEGSEDDDGVHNNKNNNENDGDGDDGDNSTEEEEDEVLSGKVPHHDDEDDGGVRRTTLLHHHHYHSPDRQRQRCAQQRGGGSSGAKAKAKAKTPVSETYVSSIGRAYRDSVSHKRPLINTELEELEEEICGKASLPVPPPAPPSSDALHAASITGFFLFELHAITELVVAFTEPDIWSTQRRIENMLQYPLRELQDIWQTLLECWRWTNRGPEKFVYSLKLSTTMTSFVAYLLSKGVGDPMFGPSQMAFASGLDTTNAVNIWVSQIVGFVVGTVFGFLLASACERPLDYIICVTVSAFVAGLVRSSSGMMSLTGLYAEFALFTTIRKWDSSDAALTSILSSVAALTIYVTVQLVVYPTKRWSVLRRAMCETLRSVKQEIAVTVTSSEALFLNASITQPPPPRRRTSTSLSNEDPRPNASSSSSANKGSAHIAVSTTASTSAPSSASSSTPAPTQSIVAVRREMERQRSLLVSAAAEPRLNQQPFPTRAVERVIAKELIFLSALQPLDLCYQTLLRHEVDHFRPALMEALAALARAAQQLVELMILVLEHPTTEQVRHQAMAYVVSERAADMRACVAVIRFEYRWLVEQQQQQQTTTAVPPSSSSSRNHHQHHPRNERRKTEEHSAMQPPARRGPKHDTMTMMMPFPLEPSSSSPSSAVVGTAVSYGALQPFLLDTLMYCTTVLGPRLVELCEAVDDLAVACRDM